MKGNFIRELAVAGTNPGNSVIKRADLLACYRSVPFVAPITIFTNYLMTKLEHVLVTDATGHLRNTIVAFPSNLAVRARSLD
jgi:hypothetical protein